MAEQQQPQMVRSEVIAQLFGLSIETVYRLTKEGVIKSQQVKGSTARLYPLMDSIKLYIEHLKGKVAKRDKTFEALNEAKLAESELKLRVMQAEAELAEGRAHSTEDVKRVWGEVMGAFRTRLLSMPTTAADRLVSIEKRTDVIEILREEIATLCGMLQEYDPSAFYAKYNDYEEAVEEEAEMSDDDLEEADA